MAAPVKFKSGSGKNNLPAGLLPAGGHQNSLDLTADTSASIAVPSGANLAIFNCPQDFYADIEDITETVDPLAEVTDGTGPRKNPIGFLDLNGADLTDADTLYFKSPVTTTVEVLFFKL